MKKILFYVLAVSGLPGLFRILFQRNAITVLMYHDIDSNSFEGNITFLKKRYNIISMDDLLNFYQERRKVPKYSVVLTFDDGHKRNFSLLPIIKKHKIPVTIFLCSGVVDTFRKFWFQTGMGKRKIEHLKKVKNRDRLAKLKKIGFFETTEYSERDALNSHEIIQMSKVVNFESHTMFHPILPQCSNEESKLEIEKSKMDLMEKYGFKIRALAYPNGDYGKREINILERAGYKAAFTTENGYNSRKTDVYKLKRIDSNDTSDIHEFSVRSSGLWDTLKRLIKAGTSKQSEIYQP